MEELALKPDQAYNASNYTPIKQPSIFKRPVASLIFDQNISSLDTNPVDNSWTTSSINTTAILGKYLFVSISSRASSTATNAKLMFYINETLSFVLAMPYSITTGSYLMNTMLPLVDFYLPIGSVLKVRFTADNALNQGYSLSTTFGLVGREIQPNDDFL